MDRNQAPATTGRTCFTLLSIKQRPQPARRARRVRKFFESDLLPPAPALNHPNPALPGLRSCRLPEVPASEGPFVLDFIGFNILEG